MKTIGKKITAILLTGVLAASLFAGCGSRAANSDAATIRIGAKGFTESEVVAEVYALALEDAGYHVERVYNISSSVIHTSLVNDEIDLYPEYTGTGLLAVLGLDPITDAQQVYDRVKAEYKEQFQVTWLDYSAANDGQGLAIRTDVAKKLGISTISDLQAHASEIRFASQGEFDERADGIPALEATYGAFDWKSTNVYDNALKYQCHLVRLNSI